MKANEKYNRIRPLKIWEILNRDTDEEHPMGTEELRAKLLECGIDAHRTTIYEDIRLLNECGYEVMSRRGRSNQYYVMDRSFSNPEIHILMDAVQAASFITDKKTKELVDKIAQLAGSQKALVLKRNSVQFNTVKSSNEHIYYSIDEILSAIDQKKKIIFKYFDYDIYHEKVYRRDGHHYKVSPFATVFADGHYYLVIYDTRYNRMINYRIDRMDSVKIIDEILDLPPASLAFNIADYKKSLFGMFSGEKTSVIFDMHSSLVDVIFDLFGDKTRIVPAGEKVIRFSADVQISDLFFGWCCSFGEKLKIVGPNQVIEQLKVYTDTIKNQYEVNNKEIDK